MYLKLDFRLAKKLVLHPDLIKMITKIPDPFKSLDLESYETIDSLIKKEAGRNCFVDRFYILSGF